VLPRPILAAVLKRRLLFPLIIGGFCFNKGGDWRREKIKPISRSYFPHSVEYYAKLTQWLGFKPNRHEGKIVGLAAFGNPNSPAYDEIKELLTCDGLVLKAPYMIGRIWHPKMPIFKDNLMTRLLKNIRGKAFQPCFSAGSRKYLSNG
jgi:predicted NodU family carbamoyl transferase